MNKERSHIVNNQGTQITQFANNIQDIDLNQKNSEQRIRGLVNEFNRGNLFKNISAESSFDKMQRNNSKTQKLKGKSGTTFGGSGNRLISQSKVPAGTGVKLFDFTFKKPKKDNVVLGNVSVPSRMTPSALPANADENGNNRTDVENYEKYKKDRTALMQQGYDEN